MEESHVVRKVDHITQNVNALLPSSSLVVIKAGVKTDKGLAKTVTDFFRYHALEVCSNVCCLYYNA